MQASPGTSATVAALCHEKEHKQDGKVTHAGTNIRSWTPEPWVKLVRGVFTFLPFIAFCLSCSSVCCSCLVFTLLLFLCRLSAQIHNWVSMQNGLAPFRAR